MVLFLHTFFDVNEIFCDPFKSYIYVLLLLLVRSVYNYLDLAAFLLAMAASIYQLVNISRKDPNGAIWNLSFSIVIIFLHMVRGFTYLTLIENNSHAGQRKCF